MTLTENGKNYIATTFGFGTNKCYVASGLSWSYLGTDNQSYNETGGTAQIVSRLIMTSLVQSVTYNGQNYTYAVLKAANNNTDLILSDAQWIAQNDGTPSGEAQYCSAVSTGSISCTTTPAGASVALDGVSQGVVTPVTLTNVSAGSHTVTFTLSGYNSCQASVTVTAGSTATASCTLTAIVTKGSISCTTIPAGASISLDGVSQGAVTPVTLTNVSAGSHTVTFTLSGYNSCQASVTVTAGSTATASCTLTPVVTTTGSISCTTTPAGASVALDGVSQGVVTPVTLTNVSAGSHTVTFTLSGYNPCIGSVTVISSSTVTTSCTLTPLAPVGSILCTTTPSGAPISLDGANIGMVTPASLLNVSAGSHTVTFTLSGYNACPVVVNVTAGAIHTASCILIPTGTCNTPSCKVQMNQ